MHTKALSICWANVVNDSAVSVLYAGNIVEIISKNCKNEITFFKRTRDNNDGNKNRRRRRLRQSERIEFRWSETQQIHYKFECVRFSLSQLTIFLQRENVCVCVCEFARKNSLSISFPFYFLTSHSRAQSEKWQEDRKLQKIPVRDGERGRRERQRKIERNREKWMKSHFNILSSLTRQKQ